MPAPHAWRQEQPGAQSDDEYAGVVHLCAVALRYTTPTHHRLWPLVECPVSMPIAFPIIEAGYISFCRTDTSEPPIPSSPAPPMVPGQAVLRQVEAAMPFQAGNAEAMPHAHLRSAGALAGRFRLNAELLMVAGAVTGHGVRAGEQALRCCTADIALQPDPALTPGPGCVWEHAGQSQICCACLVLCVPLCALSPGELQHNAAQWRYGDGAGRAVRRETLPPPFRPASGPHAQPCSRWWDLKKQGRGERI